MSGTKSFSWAEFSNLLAAKSFPVQLRMIDGELSFPDELPAENWRDLRVGSPQGMITLRRDDSAIAVVTWGDADPAMRQAWNALAWAAAEVTAGHVDSQTPPKFAAGVEMPPGFTS